MDLLTLLIALGFGAGSLALIAYGVSGYVAYGDKVSRRLDAETTLTGQRGGRAEILVAEDTRLRQYDKLLTPMDEEHTSKVRKRLERAGFRSPSAVRVYFAWKWGVTIVGFLIGAVLLALTMNPVQPLLPIIMTVFIAAISFFATDAYVERKITYRKMEIEKSFPDALDLMLVCIEAGHGLDQAMHRVAQETRVSAPTLSLEFELLVAQIRAGKERGRVLTDFAERCNVPDIAAFVTVMRQADDYGVSIADTLRVYSNEMRNKRFMRAEEKANMMPVKLALGAILFTVPPVIIILIGPSILLIVRELTKGASFG